MGKQTLAKIKLKTLELNRKMFRLERLATYNKKAEKLFRLKKAEKLFRLNIFLLFLNEKVDSFKTFGCFINKILEICLAICYLFRKYLKLPNNLKTLHFILS